LLSQGLRSPDELKVVSGLLLSLLTPTLRRRTLGRRELQTDLHSSESEAHHWQPNRHSK